MIGMVGWAMATGALVVGARRPDMRTGALLTAAAGASLGLTALFIFL